VEEKKPELTPEELAQQEYDQEMYSSVGSYKGGECIICKTRTIDKTKNVSCCKGCRLKYKEYRDRMYQIQRESKEIAANM
jgi:hypothetical protein